VTQKDLKYLVIKNRNSQHVVSFVRFMVTKEDMMYLGPVLERLSKRDYNQGLSFEVKDGGK
jgi:hypothetical protein